MNSPTSDSQTTHHGDIASMNYIFRRAFLLITSVMFTFAVPTGRTTLHAQDNNTKMTIVLKAGDPAPDFTLQDFKGSTFTLSEQLKKKGVVLWFTNLCSGCQSKMSEMERIKKRYEKKGIEIIAVSQLGEDRETVEKTIHEKKLSFKFLYDPKGETTIQYSGKYIPGTCPLKNIYLIGADSKIAFTSHYPGLEEKELTNLLNKLMKGIKQ